MILIISRIFRMNPPGVLIILGCVCTLGFCQPPSRTHRPRNPIRARTRIRQPPLRSKTPGGFLQTGGPDERLRRGTHRNAAILRRRMGALRRRPGRKRGVPFDPAHSTTIRPEIGPPIAPNKTFFVLRRGKNPSEPVSGRKISLLYRFFLNKVLFSYLIVSRPGVSDGEREGEKGIFLKGSRHDGTIRENMTPGKRKRSFGKLFPRPHFIKCPPNPVKEIAGIRHNCPCFFSSHRCINIVINGFPPLLGMGDCPAIASLR